MTAYYSENDPHAAQWLRNLITAGLIAKGDVDERDIRDVTSGDLAPYTQCHFFAGIGGWSYALRLAGWPDDRPVWTGSCPCQPFSAAGKGGGFDDERHLWPDFHHLIVHGKPRAVPVFGEQVASKDGLAWLDLVQADMEGAGYAFGATDICAAGVGAPHIRQRLYWVADTATERRQYESAVARGDGAMACSTGSWFRTSSDSDLGGLGHGLVTRPEGHGGDVDRGERRTHPAGPVAETGAACGLEHPGSVGRERRQAPTPGHDADREASERSQGEHGPGLAGAFGIPENGTGPTNGHWRAADWLYCRDDKWRAVEPGTFPLVDGSTFKLGSGGALEGKSRVGMLRAYGNLVVPQVAAAFVSAFMEDRA